MLTTLYFFQRDFFEGDSINKVSQPKTLEDIKKRSVNVADYGVRGDGITDDTEKFQFAIEDATNQKKVLFIPANTYLLSPEKYRNSKSSSGVTLSIPSNAELYFEKGAKLELVDNAPEWSRVLVLDDVSNINIYGHFEVDGSAKTVTNGNEQMHGIFIYNAKNIYIESAYSYDCYGDNLFIGGTEKEYSDNVRIDFFHGESAGRRNLVIHYVDKLHIGVAILDNSKGSVTNNWSGGNSLTLEPDDYKGKNKFYQRIDYLSTYGMGNDFTVGTKSKLAKKWILEIGYFNVELMKGSKTGLRSYASNLKIGSLLMNSKSSTPFDGIDIKYGAIWEINEAIITNGAGTAIKAKEEGKEKPNLKIRKLYISKFDGKGIELWGADAVFDTVEANGVKGHVMYIFATSKQKVIINNLTSINSGSTEVIYISDNGYAPKLVIENLELIDNREFTPKTILYLETQNAVDGLNIRGLKNPRDLNMYLYGPAVSRK